MGLYMNNFGEDNLAKAQTLEEDYGAERIKPKFIDPKTGKIALGVLHHPMWDAVCIIVDENECKQMLFHMKRFKEHGVPVTWLSIDVKTAERFSSWKLNEKD